MRQAAKNRMDEPITYSLKTVGNPQRSLWPCLAVLLLFLCAFAQRDWQRIKGNPGSPGSDFAVYYVAGRVALGEGEGRLYYPDFASKSQESFTGIYLQRLPDNVPWQRISQERGIGKTTPYIYPPFFSILLAPLSLLSFSQAFVLWRILSVIFAIWAVFLALRISGYQPVGPAWAIASVGALSFFPLIESYFLGQVGPLILFLWSLGVYLLMKKRETWSGAVFAIVTLIKITPVVVVPLFIIQRRWRWLVAYGIVFLLLTGIAIWMLGWENQFVYLTKMLPAMSSGGSKLENKSITALILELYFGGAFFTATGMNLAPAPAWVSILAKSISICVYVGILLYVARNEKLDSNLVRFTVLFALVSLIVSPLSWRHHFVLALLPLIMLWVDFTRIGNFSWKKGAILTAATLVFGGVPVADFLIPLVTSPTLKIGLSSITLLVSVFLVSQFFLSGKVEHVR